MQRTQTAILNENETGGRRGTAPVLGSEKFLYAYGTQANANQVGLLYKERHLIECFFSQVKAVPTSIFSF